MPGNDRIWRASHVRIRPLPGGRLYNHWSHGASLRVVKSDGEFASEAAVGKRREIQA
jgi:hypothetical protein